MINRFNAPIPGESLTAEQGSMPWEKPPQLDTPEAALEFYLDKLSNEEAIETVGSMMQTGVPIDIITSSMLSSGIMRGVHTVDVKTLISPMIFEHLRSLGDVMGIDYKETMEDYADKEQLKKTKERKEDAAMLNRSMLEETLRKRPELVEEIVEQPLEEPKPKGLISRKV